MANLSAPIADSNFCACNSASSTQRRTSAVNFINAGARDGGCVWEKAGNKCDAHRILQFLDLHQVNMFALVPLMRYT